MLTPSERTSPSLFKSGLRVAGLSASAVAAGMLFRLLLQPYLEHRIVWVTFYPAVMVAAVLGGLYAGITAAALSCLVAVVSWPLFQQQPFIQSGADWLGLLVFFLNGSLISGIAEASRRAKIRADRATEEALAAQQRAELANQAKSAFLASMSHELRTPLNAILGYSSLLRQDSVLSSDQRQSLDIIHRSGEHLLKLINDVLDMAKIEAGQVPLAFVPLDLRALVAEMMELMRIRAQAKGLTLVLDEDSNHPRFIETDETRLRQILLNLLGNAVKFTPDGLVTLKVEGSRVEESGRFQLRITVTDTGPGIAAEDQERIFEPFVQLKSSSQTQGTGLGLAITRKHVEWMGGELHLASLPGQGSCFRVELPVQICEAPSGTAPSETVQFFLEANQEEFRVLIVEDQPENWRLLQRILEQSGYQIRVAENGLEGVAAYQEWQPRFIWMDCRMPVMDGLEATRRIRQLPGGQEVKIVALTASVFEEQRQEILAAGMDDFIRKPYQIQEIHTCLQRYLGVCYALAEAPREDLKTPSALTPELLRHFPGEVRAQLSEALTRLDLDRIQELVAQLASHHPKEASALQASLRYHQYTAVLHALQACESLIESP